jgi:pimeloyl-ACP methyl ester carboxylesterase
MTDNTALRLLLDDTAKEFAMLPPDETLPGDISLAKYRRRRRRLSDDPVGSVSLVDRDGMLSWEDTPPSLARQKRAARRAGSSDGELVATYRFEKLEPNKIGELLVSLDKRLTPDPSLKGVRIATDGTWSYEPAAVPKSGLVLLFIHGTFSETSAILNQLVAIPEGRAFLKAAKKRYTAILAFDHRTLSVSPLLNAFDLQQAFADKQTDVHVISHSRGGLVARWWLEGFGPARAKDARAVFVGTPLNGTGLASPPRLRSTLNLLTNYGRGLQLIGEAAAAVPFVQIPLVLLKIVSSVTGVLASTPLTDAAIAMIPGLACQSRVENNEELARIRAMPPHPQYFSVRSNFEPDAVGWKFWKLFRGDRAADMAADLIFAGENDLVVDTRSMTEFSSAAFPKDRIRDFGTNGRVHHVNYFRQPETVEFLRSSLVT